MTYADEATTAYIDGWPCYLSTPHARVLPHPETVEDPGTP